MPKVLIVDDDKDLRRIYANYLAEEGFDTLEAEKSEQAWEEFRDQNLDVILLDIQMPLPDYQQLIPAIRQSHSHAKIIVFSCYDLMFQRMTVKNADDYFNKTEGTELLVSKIKNILLKN